MKVTIEIECEDEKDLMTHLSVIRQTIKSAIKENNKFEVPSESIVLTDSNCYGEHSVAITC